MYKKGGEKQDWISNKISTLLKEDPKMSQKQAISIALSLSEKQFQDGGTPKKPLFGAESMFPISRVDKNVNGDYIINYTNSQIEPATYSKEDFEAKLKLTQPSADSPGQYDPYLLKYMGKTQGRTGQTVTYQNGGTPTFNDTQNKSSNLAYPSFFEQYPAPSEPTTENPLGVSSNKELDAPKKTTENFQPMQFFNPYVDVDLAQGMNTLGQSIENGDALGIVAGGLKTLTGTARNIFGGMGQARIKNEGMKNYYDAQRDNMIGKAKNGGAFPNFQDGGNYKTTSQGLESKINETLGTTGEVKGGNSKLMGEIKLINKRNDGYGILYDTDEGDKYEVVKSNAFTGMQDLPELKRYKYKRGEYSDPNFLEDGRNVEALKRGWQSSGYNPSTTTYPESVEAYRAAIGKPSFYSQEQMVGSFQDGGEQQGQAEQIYQMVAEALQSGADPQQIAQQLIQMGLSEEQVMQIIQEVMSKMQGMQQSPQEEQIEGNMSNPQEEATEMKMGGSFYQLIGKKILGYEYNKDKDSYSVRYE